MACLGCCVDGECFDGDQAGACGASGAECSTCADEFACSEGACEPAPDTLWDVVVVSAQVLKAEPTLGWDTGGSLPDLYVEVGAGLTDDGWAYEGVTTTKDDTLSAAFSETVLENVPASVLLGGSLAIELWDDDLFTFDSSIGSCSTAIFTSAFNGEPFATCGSFGDFEVMVKFVAD